MKAPWLNALFLLMAQQLACTHTTPNRNPADAVTTRAQPLPSALRPNDVPYELMELVRDMQNYNVGHGPRQALSAAQRAIDSLDAVLVPLTEFNTYLASRFAHPLQVSELSHLLVLKNGQEHLLLPIHPSNGDLARNLVKRGYEFRPKAIPARAMVSGRTFLSWARQSDGSILPFFLKLSPKENVHVLVNPVVALDYASAVQTEEMLQGAPFSHLPEVAAFQIKEQADGVILRQALSVFDRSGRVRWRPLHSAIGQDFIGDLAQRSNRSRVDVFMHDFLPALADFYSSMMFEAGFIPAAHTQNLWIGVERSTSKILEFRVQDIGDHLYDPWLHWDLGLPFNLDMASRGYFSIYQWGMYGTEHTPSRMADNFLYQIFQYLLVVDPTVQLSQESAIDEFVRLMAERASEHVGNSKAFETASLTTAMNGTLGSRIEAIYDAFVQHRLKKRVGRAKPQKIRSTSVGAKAIRSAAGRNEVSVLRSGYDKRDSIILNDMHIVIKPEGTYVWDFDFDTKLPVLWVQNPALQSSPISPLPRVPPRSCLLFAERLLGEGLSSP